MFYLIITTILWKCFKIKILFLLFNNILAQQKQQQNCFEKQYNNLIINFNSLQIVKRIGIISPPNAFYLAHYIDEEIAERRIKNYKIEKGDDRNFLKMSNGEKLIIYSSNSAHNLEWSQTEILTKIIHLISINFKNKTIISPIIFINYCKITNTKQPISISNSFTVNPKLLGISSSSYENELIINFKTFENDGRIEIYFDFGANQRNVLIGGLALNDGIEIGGRNDEYFSEKFELNLENGFNGCFARIILNNVDLLFSTSLELKECQIPQPQLFSLGLSTSLQIPYTFLPFSLDFYLIPNSGPLLTILDNENSSLLQIKIIEKEEEKDKNYLISINTEFNGDKPKIFSIEPPGWHSLILKLRSDSLDLILNSKTVFWVQGNKAKQIGTSKLIN
uniref:LAM_G_DOMAIN domain-containing protein n=1 Tax=Meloidogyne hapla TaxID=6305 RepID=A0A1I8BR57_MELHA